MRRSIGTMLLAVAALTAGACDDNKAPTEPTPPTVTVTDKFSGMLGPNGGVTHTFSTASGGSVTATLTELQPEAETLLIGIALGTWNGTTSTCTLIVTNDKAIKNALVSATATGAVNLCLRVSDAAGVIVTPVSYTVEVVHP